MNEQEIRDLLAAKPGRLSREEEHTVFAYYQEHKSQELRNDIAMANMGLVQQITGRMALKDDAYEDCIQNGFLGLIHAVEKFDPDYGTRFSTYATYWIRVYITRLGLSDTTAVHIPRQALDTLKSLPDWEDLMAHPELYDDLTENEKSLVTIAHNSKNAASIEQQTHEDSDDTLGDNIQDYESTDPYANAEMQTDVANALGKARNFLSDEQMQVIIEYYGFYTGSPKTLKAIAQEMRIDASKVRQLRDSALVLLKRHDRMLGLSEYMQAKQ